MKITSSQLRSIIAEEVARVKRARLAEGAEDVGLAASTFVDGVAASWESTYDAADPVMAAEGPEAWAAQVEGARSELEEGLEALLREVEDKLFGGAYA